MYVLLQMQKNNYHCTVRTLMDRVGWQ